MQSLNIIGQQTGHDESEQRLMVTFIVFYSKQLNVPMILIEENIGIGMISGTFHFGTYHLSYKELLFKQCFDNYFL